MKRLLLFLVIVRIVFPSWTAAAQSQTKDFIADPVLVDDILRIQKRVALVVGIEYPHGSPYNILKWTVDDAVEIGCLLQEQYGFDVICAITNYPEDEKRKARAIRLNARVGEKYTDKAGLDALFDELIQNSKNPEDQVVVFVSGHGKQHPKNPKIGYIVPTGGNIDQPRTTMINMDVFEKLQLEARHALFVLDSCYSGISGAFAGKAQNDGSGKQTAVQVKRLMGSKARQILAAGDTWQEARMYPQMRMSAFAYWLKYALEPEGSYVRADLTGDGVVTLGELYEYVYPKLDSQFEQRPRRFDLAGADGQFVFAHVKLDLSTKAKTIPYRERMPEPAIRDPRAPQPEIRIIDPEIAPVGGPGGIAFVTEPSGDVSLELVAIDGGYRRHFNACPAAVHSLNPGRYRAKFSRDLYKDLKIEVTVKSGRFEPIDVKLRPDFGKLVVNSEPAGAVVWLTDMATGREQRLGQTPLERSRQPSGRYRLRLELDHYKPETVDLVVIAEETETSTVSLAPDFGYLCVDSDPKGADVLLDGKKIGETPLDYHRLDSGEYYLSIRKDWYLPEPDKRLSIAAGGTERRFCFLEKNFFRLVLRGNPEGQPIYDETGALLGKLPAEVRLKPGDHKIRIGEDRQDAPFLPRIIEGVFPRGKEKTVDDIVLKRNTGTLMVTAEPNVRGARVYIDGETKSEWKTPCSIPDVTVGQRAVKCVDEKTGRSGTESVLVSSGKVAPATVQVGVREPPQEQKRNLTASLGPGGKPARDGRFVKYPNGIVYDTANKREWLAGPDKDTTWYEARDWVNGLNRNGFEGGGWELPSMSQLKELHNEGKGSRNMTPLLETFGWWIWSSEKKSASAAWAYNFYDDGKEFCNGLGARFYRRVFAVRSR